MAAVRTMSHGACAAYAGAGRMVRCAGGESSCVTVWQRRVRRAVEPCAPAGDRAVGDPGGWRPAVWSGWRSPPVNWRAAPPGCRPGGDPSPLITERVQ